MVLGGVVGQKVLADGIPKESLTRILAQVKIRPGGQPTCMGEVRCVSF